MTDIFSQLPKDWAILFSEVSHAPLDNGPRAGRLAVSELERRLPKAGGNEDCLRCLALLWHDHFDPAHEICQDDPSSDGSLLHAILHRREPDYWNSKYWFRRVGAHPSLKEMSKRAGALIRDAGDSELVTQLLPRGEWDAFAFVDACEKGVKLPENHPRHELLRRLQAAESAVLAEHFLRA